MADVSNTAANSDQFSPSFQSSIPDGQSTSGGESINTDEDVELESPASLEPDQQSEDEFISAQCLFCNRIHATLEENLTHMLKIHGLFIPSKEHLVVDVETLIAHLHLVIFAYFECLHCGTERGSAEAVQQHMMGKGHCRFDISREDSEFRDFYDFDSSPGIENGEDGEAPPRLSTIPIVQPDDNSLRLPSGKILTHRLDHQSHSRRHRPQSDIDSQSQLRESTPSEPSSPPAASDAVITYSTSTPGSTPTPTSLTKAEKRGVTIGNQLAQLRAEDRRSLMHLPTSQQRALLSTQKKQMDQARKSERAMRGRVEGMGNKTLMKHYLSDVSGKLPVQLFG